MQKEKNILEKEKIKWFKREEHQNVKFTNKKKKRKKDIRKVRTKARKIERKEDRSKESVWIKECRENNERKI